MSEDVPVSLQAVILKSAADAFVAEGFAPASMAAIAEQAGVGTDMLHATFGSKAKLLAAVIAAFVDNSVFAGAHDTIAHAATGSEVIGALADVGYRNCERGYTIFRLGMQNAAADAVIEVAMARAANVFQAQLRNGVDRLVELGVSEHGQSRADAVDILYFYLGPPAWRFLIDAGWSLERARDFLADRARSALLLHGRRCA